MLRVHGRWRARGILAAFVLPLLGWLIFSCGLGGGFLFDDYPNLVNDPDWKLEQLSWTALHNLFGSGIASVLGRPLALSSFAMNHVLAGMDPVVLKATGLGMHLFNALLVLLLSRRLLGMTTAMTGNALFAVAWTVAFLWMAHPIQVSSALYVVQRMEVGAATGILLSLLAYLGARRAMCEGRRAWPCLLAAMAAAGFGLGFKETALLAPAYALILELFVLRFAARIGWQRKLLIGAYVVGLLGGLIIFIGWVVPAAMVPTAYATRDFSLSERLYSQLPVLLLYLKQMLLPWPESLWFYYDNFPISRGFFHPASTLAAGLVLCLLAMAAWLLRRCWPLTSLGIAWFFVSHALTSNVHPLELAFEHRNYLALLGVVLALVQPLCAVLRSVSQDARALLVALPLAFVGAMGWVQANSWGEPVHLALTLTTRNPDSARAGYEYGRTLLGLSAHDPQSPGWSMAIQEFEHAATLPLSSPLPDQALIILQSREGATVSEAVWKRFGEKLMRHSVGPQELSALEGVVECRAAGGCQFADERPFFTILVTTVQANPQSSRLRAIYANYAFNVIGDAELAMRVMREAVALAPQDPDYRSWLVRMGLASNLLEPVEAKEAMELLSRSKGRGAHAQDVQRLRQWLDDRIHSRGR